MAYLGSMSVTDASFTDQGTDLLVDWSSPMSPMKFDPVVDLMKKAGCWGTGRVTVWLSNMSTAVAIVGLSSIDSWTHNNPRCRHLITSLIEHVFLIVGSTNSNGAPSFHCFHAYTILSFRRALKLINSEAKGQNQPTPIPWINTTNQNASPLEL